MTIELKNLVKIDKRFENSVNLYLDCPVDEIDSTVTCVTRLHDRVSRSAQFVL